MNFATCSLTENVRREQFQGEEHLVVPVVALRENVLEGHPQGDIFVSEEEIKKSATLWNGTAITVGHPEKRGKPVSANRKEILDEKTVGRLLNIEMNGDKLTGDMFLNIDRLEQVNNGEDVIETLEENELLEVSTGYFSDFLTDLKPNAERELPNNADDAHVNIRPDHLALLPNSKGKCSVEDGCGAPRANEIVVCQLEQSRTPDSLIYNETSTGDWSAVDKTLEDYVVGYFDNTDNLPDDFDFESESEAQGTDWGELPRQIRQWIAQHSLLGDANAESFSEGLFFPVVSSEDVLFENALEAVNSGRGAAAEISDQQLQSARGVARTLLEDEFDRDLEGNTMDENEAKSAFQKLRQYFFGNQESLGQLIQEERESMEEMSQDDLAEETPVTASTISAIENGEIEMPSLPVLQAIMDALDLSEAQVTEFIDLDELPEDVAENRKSENEDDNAQEGGDEGMSENEEEQEEAQEQRVSVNDLAEDLGYEDADELRSALEFVKNQKEEQEQEREALVEQLAENARCQFNEDELSKKGLGELRKIADMADVETNHALNGSNTKTNEDDAEDYSSPAVFASTESE